MYLGIQGEEVMVLADTMAIFFVITGLIIALPALWLLCKGLWPVAVESTTGLCHQGLFKSFLCGLPLTVAAIFGFGMLTKLGSAGGVAAAGLLSIYVIYSSVGIAGLVTAVGQKLPSPEDESCPWKATRRGSIVLVLSFVLPFIGWFVILPSSLLIGCGSATRYLITRVVNRRKNLATLGVS